MAGSPFAAQAAAPQPTSQAKTLRVTGFDVEEVDRVEPGAERNFTVWGRRVLQCCSRLRVRVVGETLKLQR